MVFSNVYPVLVPVFSNYLQMYYLYVDVIHFSILDVNDSDSKLVGNEVI